MLMNMGHFPSLTDLYLRTHDLRVQRSTKLAIPFHKTPVLRNLTIETELRLAPISKPPQGHSQQLFPPLRMIRLQKCPRLNGRWLRSVFDGLEREGNREGVEAVVIFDCPRLVRDDLLEFIPAEILEYPLKYSKCPLEYSKYS